MNEDAAKAIAEFLADQMKINVRVLRLLIRTVEMDENNEEELRDITDAVAEMLPQYVKLTKALKGTSDGD